MAAFCLSLPLLLILVSLITCTHRQTSAQLTDNQLLLLKKNPQWAKPGHSRSISKTQNGAIILEMKHMEYYCSQGTTLECQELKEKRLIDDDIRVRSIQSRIKGSPSSRVGTETDSHTQIPVNSGIKLQTLNYVVTIILGSRNLTVIVDTGSDLTWVQCQPCKLCYTQPEPFFNPLVSPSYKSVQCHSPACQTLEYATGNSGYCGNDAPVCNYAVTYGDGSYTHGELGTDLIVLGNVPVDNFVFGCGHINRGLFGAASGLMGLGRSDLSLISQTSHVFDGVFSYCLPDTEGAASGSLQLGRDGSGYKNTTPVSYTRLGTNAQLYSFYTLNLTGTTVGGVPLQPPSFGKSGILIDSGTVITRLPPSIYRSFKTEFLKQFSGYPQAPGFSILDTCFNLSAYDEVSVPTVRMQFEGDAELSVDITGMMYFAKKDASQVCLAVASLAYEGEIGIIGNYQQRNTRVVYDTKGMKVGFAKELCSFS